MITDSFTKFGPGISCFEYGTEGYWVIYKNGSSRRMTQQEEEWIHYQPTDDIKELDDYNRAEAGAPECDHCGKFHPDLKSWKDWSALCPDCVADGEEYYRSMWEECCSWG